MSTDDQIAPVIGRGAEIADGLGIGRGDAARFGHGFRRDGAAFEIRFRLGRANDLGRDGSEADARRHEDVFIEVEPNAGGDVHERERLSLAQTKFQEMRGLGEISLGDNDLREQFIGFENGLAGADPEFAKRHLAAAGGSRDAGFGFQRHQCGAAIHRGNRRHQIAAEGAEVAGLHRADGMRRVDERREQLADDR